MLFPCEHVWNGLSFKHSSFSSYLYWVIEIAIMSISTCSILSFKWTQHIPINNFYTYWIFSIRIYYNNTAKQSTSLLSFNLADGKKSHTIISPHLDLASSICWGVIRLKILSHVDDLCIWCCCWSELNTRLKLLGQMCVNSISLCIAKLYLHGPMENAPGNPTEMLVLKMNSQRGIRFGPDSTPLFSAPRWKTDWKYFDPGPTASTSWKTYRQGLNV